MHVKEDGPPLQHELRTESASARQHAQPGSVTNSLVYPSLCISRNTPDSLILISILTTPQFHIVTRNGAPWLVK